MEMQDPNIAKNLPSEHHRTTLSGYIFATKARIDNRRKLVKQQYLLHTCSQYRELRRTSGWDLLASFGHPSKFQRVSRLGSITARHSSSLRQPNFAALSRERHLHRVSNNVPPLACYNFDTHEWILIFFGRNVTDKVGNQTTLYYVCYLK